MEFTIKGIEEVCALLDTAPTRIIQNSFAKGLASAAVPLVERLEVDTPVDTGLLKSSIKSVIQINTDGKGGTLAVGFGKQGYVARMIEFGHRIVGHKPNKKDTGKGVSGKPFMRIAAAATADDAIEAFTNSMIESLRSNI